MREGGTRPGRPGRPGLGAAASARAFLRHPLRVLSCGAPDGASSGLPSRPLPPCPADAGAGTRRRRPGQDNGGGMAPGPADASPRRSRRRSRPSRCSRLANARSPLTPPAPPPAVALERPAPAARPGPTGPSSGRPGLPALWHRPRGGTGHQPEQKPKRASLRRERTGSLRGRGLFLVEQNEEMYIAAGYTKPRTRQLPTVPAR